MTFTPVDYGRLADLLERDGLSKETQRYLSMVNARIILAALRAMADGGAFAAGARAMKEVAKAEMATDRGRLATDSTPMIADAQERRSLVARIEALPIPACSDSPVLDPATWRKACEAAAKWHDTERARWSELAADNRRSAAYVSCCNNIVATHERSAAMMRSMAGVPEIST